MSESTRSYARPALLERPPAPHGALDYAELERLGIVPLDVIDFSSNINPYGPPSAALEALQQVQYQHYPDRQVLALRRALAEQLSWPVEGIVAGNGTAELIWLLCLAFIRPESAVLILGPTFGEYERCARLAGGEVMRINGRARDDFILAPEQIRSVLAQLRPALVFLCNPNNPTGTIIEAQEIGRWAREYAGTLFVVDEAYLPFAAGCSSVLSLAQENIMVLRSLTKDYALAGLRLGCLAGLQALIERVDRLRPAWNVNAAAQAAGLAALRDRDFLPDSLAKLKAEMHKLVHGLQELGLKPLPSSTHFFIVDVGGATAFRRRLLVDYHIQVRDCSSFDLPDYVRIATRTAEENGRLLQALAEVRR